MPFRRNCLAILLALLGPSTAFPLEWQTTTVEARTEPFQKTLTRTFTFKNASEKAVAILELKTDCSCITATTDKKIYAPGEAGLLTAQFDLAERAGLYERHLSVVTDETSSPQHLTLEIEVPEPATLTPRSVEWHLKEDLTEKVIELKTAESLRITFTQATLTNDSFVVRLETIVADQVYQLVVTPRNTVAVANAAIRIHGHDASGREVLVSAYANVR